MSRFIGFVAAIGVLASIAACDPCAGVGACNTGPRVSVEGTLVNSLTGLGAPNVRVDLVRTAGVALESDSLSVVTDAEGHWQISVPASRAGDAVVDINVRPPNHPPYRATGFHLSTSDRRGDGHVLPTWVVDPIFGYAVELHYRARSVMRAANVPIEFRRTGGIDYYINTTNPVFQAVTDDAGRVALFDIAAHATGLGDLVGDVIAHLPAPFAPDTIRGLRLSATPLLHPATQILVLGVGPYLPWVGYIAIGGRGAQGVQAEFHRTGGIQVDPSDYVTTSDASGYLALSPQPLSSGIVEADLIIHSPAPYATVTAHLRIPTVADDVTGGVFAAWDLDATAKVSRLPTLTVPFGPRLGTQIKVAPFPASRGGSSLRR